MNMHICAADEPRWSQTVVLDDSHNDLRSFLELVGVETMMKLVILDYTMSSNGRTRVQNSPKKVNRRLSIMAG